MKAGKTVTIAALASVPLIMTLSNSMLIPILPTLEKELGVSSLKVSLLITVYSIIAILLIPVAGYLSDRFGRKKVIIPSLILAAMGGLVSALAASLMKDGYWVILLGRLLQGIGAAGAAPIIFPLTGDLFRSDKEVSSALGLVETANMFGKVLSPILGSLLALVIWYLPFYAIPVISLLSALLLILFIPKPQAKSETQPVPFGEFWSQIKLIFNQKGKWLCTIFLVGGTCMLVVFAVLFYLSELLENKHHMKGIIKGATISIPMAVLCLTSYITGKIIGARKKLMYWMSVTSMIILTASTLACVFFLHSSIVALFFTISTASLGIGAVLPCMDAFITEGTEKEQRGTVTSLYSSMRFTGVALGPPLASLLVNPSAKILFYSLTGLSAVTTIIVIALIKPKSKEPDASPTS